MNARGIYKKRRQAGRFSGLMLVNKRLTMRFTKFNYIFKYLAIAMHTVL